MEDIKGVLDKYDIEVINIKLESYKGKKGVWWVKTPYDYKILKKQSFSDKTLEFIIDAVEHLTRNGVYIPEIIKTKDGNKYALIDGTCYVLSQAIQGKTLNYSTSENIKRIVQELANFHKGSKGFKPSENYKTRTHLGLWIDKYKDEMNKIKKYYDMEVSNSYHSEFGRIILNEFPHFYNRIETAVNGFDEPHYHKWVNEVKNTGGLCHQDFTAGNLVLADSGNLYVLDTDSLTVDIPLRDIRKILNKIMKRKNGGWDYELTKDILRWYQMKNPLEDYQWEVLKPTLTYPHLFSGIMRKYYEKREKTWTEAKYVKRLKEMIDIEKSVEPIIKNFNDIIPV
ncbi:CotS family spore coat protein [Tepidibacter formicigenes]|jgi:spore coat-associated protein S|uniref:Spore coat-associated protein S n=1 Tax=Tepidibacter formicigenes DSM 15518 TaxID=1123349 RepID=A0A1M6N0V1_9FIRM|nr:CotS family spore coat protein [Tepidibacter formicigenes]SHJ89359.1 spore coat-associated protein S [Tepidibacter formicigenes DSM 15518]